MRGRIHMINIGIDPWHRASELYVNRAVNAEEDSSPLHPPVNLGRVPH